MRSYPWFVRRDVDGLFGLMIDNLINLMVIAHLMTTLLRMPSWVVYGRILPGAGLSLLIGNIYYAWQAGRLARREGRTDVTALPYGINTPTVYAFIFLIMLPVQRATGDWRLAWHVGLAACFINGLIELAGAFFGEGIRRITPSPALLATLAGIAIAFISLSPTLEVFRHPIVGLLPMAIIMASYFGRMRFPLRLPGGLVAIVLGAIVAWSIRAMDPAAIRPAVESLGAFLPHITAGGVVAGLKALAPYVAVIAPLAVANALGTMQNVESAARAGDAYPTRSTMVIDAVGTLSASLFGSCFPTSVYIGHPGWKALGARRGYSAANGVVMMLLCSTGLIGLVLALIPKEAGLPILLWVGLIIAAQAFQSFPPRYAPAVAAGFIPHIAAWGLTYVRGALSAAGTTPEAVGANALVAAGVEYDGLVALAGGALLSAMMLTAIMCHLIDRRFAHAALWSLGASACSFVGLIHAETVRLAAAPGPAIGYLMMAAFFGIMSLGRVEAIPDEMEPAPASAEGA